MPPQKLKVTVETGKSLLKVVQYLLKVLFKDFLFLLAPRVMKDFSTKRCLFDFERLCGICKYFDLEESPLRKRKCILI